MYSLSIATPAPYGFATFATCGLLEGSRFELDPCIASLGHSEHDAAPTLPL